MKKLSKPQHVVIDKMLSNSDLFIIKSKYYNHQGLRHKDGRLEMSFTIKTLECLIRTGLLFEYEKGLYKLAQNVSATDKSSDFNLTKDK